MKGASHLGTLPPAAKATLCLCPSYFDEGHNVTGLVKNAQCARTFKVQLEQGHNRSNIAKKTHCYSSSG